MKSNIHIRNPMNVYNKKNFNILYYDILLLPIRCQNKNNNLFTSYLYYENNIYTLCGRV